MTSPYVMHDPLHDHTPTRDTITAIVPFTHALNLTLPPAPTSTICEQAFVVVEAGCALPRLLNALSTDPTHNLVYASRTWDNADYTDLLPPGKYVSIRGALPNIRRLINAQSLFSQVVYSSPNFKE